MMFDITQARNERSVGMGCESTLGAVAEDDDGSASLVTISSDDGCELVGELLERPLAFQGREGEGESLAPVMPALACGHVFAGPP